MNCSEPLFVLKWIRTDLHGNFFYCAQVSIAGQPGGVEAARVKIRVSWNTVVLKGYSFPDGFLLYSLEVYGAQRFCSAESFLQ